MYDLANLKKLAVLGDNAPKAMQAFEAFNTAVFGDGALSVKTKELIAVAIAIAVQCPYCIEVHKKNAVKAGATERELSEATFVAAAIGAGAAVTHGTHAL
ncbi:MAG: carboxymuconolactone decarboxylase family protein [Geminicoccaceae bacterium]